jgi:hypothetical protein
MRVLFSHVCFYLDLYSDIIFSLVEIGRGAELCFRTGALVGTAAPPELFFSMGTYCKYIQVVAHSN